MGRLTEKPNRYRIFGQTDTETDVGIQQTENTEKPTEKNRLYRLFRYSLIHSGDCVQCIETSVVITEIECNHALLHCVMHISQNEQFRIP